MVAEIRIKKETGIVLLFGYAARESLGIRTTLPNHQNVQNLYRQRVVGKQRKCQTHKINLLCAARYRDIFFLCAFVLVWLVSVYVYVYGEISLSLSTYLQPFCDRAQLLLADLLPFRVCSPE